MRKRYIDIIRIIAVIGVIVIHVSAQNFYTVKYTSYEWNIFNIYDSLVRFVVPILFMISGALFLDDNKKIDIKQLYKKNILRLFTAYIFWSIFYAFFNTIVILNKPIVFNEIIKLIVKPSYHLWFVPVLICIYILLPFIKKFINKDNMYLVKYFLILFFIFGPLKDTYLRLFETDNINTFLKVFKPQLMSSYIGYFVLGYYLDNIDLNKIKRISIYIIGILSVVISIILNIYFSYKEGINTTILYDYHTLPSLLSGVAVFIFIKYKTYKSDKLNKLSSLTFGIYLVHVFILDYLNQTIINSLSINPILSVPLLTLIVLILSTLLVFILSKIPLLKKYII